MRADHREVGHSKNSSVKYQKAIQTNLPKDHSLYEEAAVNIIVTPTPNRNIETNSVKSDEEAIIIDETEVDNDLVETRYTESRGYKNADFSDFEVFEDSASQVSDYDLQFYQQHNEYDNIKNLSTAKLMSPFDTKSNSCNTSTSR